MVVVLLVLLKRPRSILYSIKLDLLWPERQKHGTKTYKNQKLHNPQLQIIFPAPPALYLDLSHIVNSACGPTPQIPMKNIWRSLKIVKLDYLPGETCKYETGLKMVKISLKPNGMHDFNEDQQHLESSLWVCQQTNIFSCHIFFLVITLFHLQSQPQQFTNAKLFGLWVNQT